MDPRRQLPIGIRTEHVAMSVRLLELAELLEHDLPSALLPPVAPNLVLREPLPRNFVEELLFGQRHVSFERKVPVFDGEEERWETTRTTAFVRKKDV
jgi:hypothetical protein